MTHFVSAVSAVLAVLAIAACGTQTLRVEPVKVEPIHMTVDINLHDAGGPARR
ncbi:MAG TPA: hypothetical protein VFK02_30455 [Kofleriaceae bacterium]|nr:hypothetical protein [Kofleriaceae bacterium]